MSIARICRKYTAHFILVGNIFGKRWLLWITLAGLAVRILAWAHFRSNIHLLVTTRLPDDALYYCAIARNLASGHGISFDGIHPTNGMHPLWLLFLTPVFLLGLSKWGCIHVILLLQSVMDAGIVWLIGHTVYELLPDSMENNRRTAAGVAALLYALSPLVVIRSINGLETTLMALMLLLWLRAYMRTLPSKRGSWILLGIATGLLLLARTDSFIILSPLIVWDIWKMLRFPSRNDARQVAKEFSQTWLLAGSIALVIVAPWLWWNFTTFGSLLQSSAEAVPLLAMRKYHAMYGAGYVLYLHLLLEAAKNALKPFWYSTLGVSLLTLAYCVIARRRAWDRRHRTIFLLLLGGILLLIVHSLFRGFIREWYVEELLPIFLIGYGVSIGLNAGSTKLSSGVWRLAVLVILLLAYVFHQSPYLSQSTIVETGVPLVEQLSADHRIASFNSGYYGYFASRPGSVVNLDGVVNSDALKALIKGRIGDYLQADSVSYILDFEGDFGGYINLFDRHMLDHFVAERLLWGRNRNEPLLLYRNRAVHGDTLMPYTE
jgi:hypothetical protein